MLLYLGDDLLLESSRYLGRNKMMSSGMLLYLGDDLLLVTHRIYLIWRRLRLQWTGSMSGLLLHEAGLGLTIPRRENLDRPKSDRYVSNEYLPKLMRNHVHNDTIPLELALTPSTRRSIE
jgi:hypothetical protein